MTDETMQEVADSYDVEARMVQAETDREMQARQAWDDARAYCPHDEYSIEEDNDGPFAVCNTCGTVSPR